MSYLVTSTTVHKPRICDRPMGIISVSTRIASAGLSYSYDIYC